MAELRKFNRIGIVEPHVVTATEASANAVSFLMTDVQLVPTVDLVYTVQVRRAGVEIPGFKVTYTKATAVLKAEDAGSANLTADDVIYIMAQFQGENHGVV